MASFIMLTDFVSNNLYNPSSQELAEMNVCYAIIVILCLLIVAIFIHYKRYFPQK